LSQLSTRPIAVLNYKQQSGYCAAHLDHALTESRLHDCTRPNSQEHSRPW